MRLQLQKTPTQSIWDEISAFGQEIWGGGENVRYLTPRTDVIQKNDKYVMQVDLPGVLEGDVDIKIKEGVLSLSSAAHEESEKKGEVEGDYLLRERRDFFFQRSFRLPKDVQEDGIQARFERGVLVITLPRRPEAQPRVISIKAN